MTDAPGLAALEADVARDLARLEEPVAPWVPPRLDASGERVADVAVVGAGMAGLATAAALIRQGVTNLSVIDQAPAGRAGPWATWARMETLRSPKELAGPALGLPSLTFRAWYEAQFGAAGWAALDKIPRLMWADYLGWYQRVMGIAVTPDTRLVDLDGDADGVTLTLAGGRTLRARFVVLANGRDGLGGPVRPPLYGALGDRAPHSSDDIDFAALAGKAVVVVGAGASAFDNAATALEAGAARVTMLSRRADLPRVNKSLAANHPGFAKGFAKLPEAERRVISAYMKEVGAPSPRHSVLRCTRDPGFALWTGAVVTAAMLVDGRPTLDTNLGRLEADLVILGTGFGIDWAVRPELARLAARAARWGGVAPADGRLVPPDLGQNLAFRDVADPASWVGRVICMNNGAIASHGRIAGDIPGISVGAMRAADGLVTRLFVEDFATHFEQVRRFDRPELTGEEWTVAAGPAKTPAHERIDA